LKYAEFENDIRWTQFKQAARSFLFDFEAFTLSKIMLSKIPASSNKLALLDIKESALEMLLGFFLF